MRIKHDDAVGLSPLVVAGMVHKGEADGVDVLEAAMKGDVEAAGVVSVVATRRDVSVAELGHGDGRRREGERNEGGLIDGDDVREVGSSGRVEGAVDPLKHVSSRIVAAVVHVGFSEEAAGVAVVLSDEGVGSGDREVHVGLGSGDVVRVKVGHLFRNAQDQFVIERAVEDEHLGSLQIDGVIDRTGGKSVLDSACEHRGRDKIGVFHAGRESDSDVGLRTFRGKEVRIGALKAISWATLPKE